MCVTIKDLFRIMATIPGEIMHIAIKGRILHIIYDKREPHLTGFKSDEEVDEYIRSYVEYAYMAAVIKKDNRNYVLNICSVKDYHAFPWQSKWSIDLLNRQLSIYHPVIEWFVDTMVKKRFLLNG